MPFLHLADLQLLRPRLAEPLPAGPSHQVPLGRPRQEGDEEAHGGRAQSENDYAGRCEGPLCRQEHRDREAGREPQDGRHLYGRAHQSQSGYPAPLILLEDGIPPGSLKEKTGVTTFIAGYLRH